MAVDSQMLGIMIARRSMIVDIVVGTGSAILVIPMADGQTVGASGS
jgi:hypothetical protein